MGAAALIFVFENFKYKMISIISIKKNNIEIIICS